MQNTQGYPQREISKNLYKENNVHIVGGQRRQKKLQTGCQHKENNSS